MSIDATLNINSKYEPEEIFAVIDRLTGDKGFTTSTHTPRFFRYNFSLKGNKRSMSIFLNSKNPLGTCTHLNMDSDNNACELLCNIGKVFGGYLTENDCDGVIKEIHGEMDEGDGLPFFIRHGIVHDGNNHRDIKALKKTITNFEKRCNYGNKINS